MAEPLPLPKYHQVYLVLKERLIEGVKRTSPNDWVNEALSRRIFAS
jgi:hypothetical protein